MSIHAASCGVWGVLDGSVGNGMLKVPPSSILPRSCSGLDELSPNPIHSSCVRCFFVCVFLHSKARETLARPPRHSDLLNRKIKS